MLTVLAAVVLATAPGVLLALALPAGRDRWAAWAGAPALTLGLTGVAMGWLPRLGLPRGAGAVLVGEVALAAAVVLAARLRQRRRPARPLDPVRRRRPGTLDLVCLGVPAALAVTLGVLLLGRVRRPTGLGRHEPRAADAQHHADRQHRGGLGVHLRLPPPGGLLRLLPAGGRRLLGPGRPADRRSGRLGHGRLGRRRGPGPARHLRLRVRPRPRRPPRRGRRRRCRDDPGRAAVRLDAHRPGPRAGRARPQRRGRAAGRPRGPGPPPAAAGVAGRGGRGRDRPGPHVRRAVRRRPRGRAAGLGARPAHRAVGGVDARCRGRHHASSPSCRSRSRCSAPAASAGARHRCCAASSGRPGPTG